MTRVYVCVRASLYYCSAALAFSSSINFLSLSTSASLMLSMSDSSGTLSHGSLSKSIGLYMPDSRIYCDPLIAVIRKYVLHLVELHRLLYLRW